MTATTPSRAVATLARDLADFLVEFSIVLHKRAMYPTGHPHLQESAERFVDRLEHLLQSRDGLQLGVARHQLIVAGVATDPRNALLSDLARRLHRHRVASIRFAQGVTLGEIDDLLGALSQDPYGEHGPLGLNQARLEAWASIVLQPPELNRLFLQDESSESPASPGNPRGAPGEELWLGLANLALSADGDGGAGRDDPLLVARAIDSQSDTAYDRIVLDYLGQMAEEMSGRAGAWEPRVRERVSRLIGSLQPDTLRRLLEAGADHAERRQFALTAAEVLAVDAVVEVVEAAAVTTGQTISHHLLRLLHKFAHHAEQGTGHARQEAESVLRKNVARLITNWNLEDPNPGEYTAMLDFMVRSSPTEAVVESEGMGCDPEAVLQIALETGCQSPRVYAAVDALLKEGRLTRVAHLLEQAPSARVADPIWQHVATPARLREALSGPQIDFAAAEALTKRLGARAVEPLLDRLDAADDQATRARALKLLVAVGPPAAAPAVARLARAPWFLQRNLLVLLRRVGTLPEGFSPVPYAMHQDPRVRREAYKLLLETPAYRSSTISRGLEDPNDGIVRLVLRSALEGCPPEAHRSVAQLVGARRRSPELRALAVRVLANSNSSQALPGLLKVAGGSYGLWRWRLAPKSPVVLAAIAALAGRWKLHPQAARLLERARRHPDPEVRLATEAYQA